MGSAKRGGSNVMDERDLKIIMKDDEDEDQRYPWVICLLVFCLIITIASQSLYLINQFVVMLK